MTDDEIAELHPVVPDWQLTEDGGIKRLDRSFKFADFIQAMVFADSVGEAAEDEGHHPRLTVEWGRVNVAWWDPQDQGACTATTFIMAAKDERPLLRSGIAGVRDKPVPPADTLA